MTAIFLNAQQLKKGSQECLKLFLKGTLNVRMQSNLMKSVSGINNNIPNGYELLGTQSDTFYFVEQKQNT